MTETGAGTPLVLLPAFPFDSRCWDRARPGLAEHARVITPDPPGFGRTPLGNTEPDVAAVAAAVVELLDRLELDQVVLGGCSMGGYVAMAVLRRAPSRVAGLLLTNTRHTADPQQAKENRYAMAERVERDGVGWLADEMVPLLLGPTTLDSRPDVVDSVRRLISETAPASVAWGQRAMAARPDSAAVLRDADLPALVVHGERDALIPVDAARSMTDLLPRGELVVLPKAGHLPQLETPADFSAAVIAWLGSL